jgi:hypothetical protein
MATPVPSRRAAKIINCTVDHFLIHGRTELDASGRARRFRASSLQGGTDSLRARKNSLLRCVGNLYATHCIRRGFRDGCSKKTAESAKFPAFFPATREFGTLGDCRIDPRRAAGDPDCREAGHARNTGIMLAARGIFSAPPRRNLIVGFAPSAVGERAQKSGQLA